MYAYGAFYNQSQYYLASYADKVYLAPDGAVLVKGYSAYSMYFKTLLDKLDVTTHVFRVGTYKSAVEPFLRDDMSEDAKANATRWIGQLWGAYVDDVSTNREIAPSVLTPSMDDFLASLKNVDGDLAALSKEMGLVDELATKPQVNEAMIEAFGSDGDGALTPLDTMSILHPYRLTSQPLLTIKSRLWLRVVQLWMANNHEAR